MSDRVIDIYADKGWQDTGFELPARAADTGWSLRAEGTWCFDTSARDYATRDGDARKPGDTRFYDASTAGRTEYLYHGRLGQVGQLIGRWGRNGRPFIVGTYANLEFVGPEQPEPSMPPGTAELMARIEFIEALAARPEVVSASTITYLRATDDHIYALWRSVYPDSGFWTTNDLPDNYTLGMDAEEDLTIAHLPPAERWKAIDRLIPQQDPPAPPPVAEVEPDSGPRTLWLAMNNDENGFHNSDGHLVVSIKSYDRSRRTQYNTVKQRWEYEDGTPVKPDASMV
ncbi:hypothetical protein [Saccharothrix hoggarensis]|uniref:MORN repeat protein n=1 Tax=Saccharothrix hoggarensis TaxID=913853 RepID=A0ABW3QI59_9PSEU